MTGLRLKSSLSLIFVAILAAAVFAPTAMWLWSRWTISIWHNGHGMFVPLIVAYLAYQSLKSEPSKEEESSGWGFAFVIPGLLLVIVDSVIRTQLLSAIGLILFVIGSVALLLGLRRTRALFFPLLLLFFMLPIPTAFVENIVLVLRRLSAAGCEYVLNTTGLPVLREFTTLRLPSGTIEIADACSGFSTLYASVTMALILCYLISSNARRALILISAVPLAISCNILRCALLGYLVHYRGIEVLETQLHPLTGIFSFSMALGLLYFISSFRTRKEQTIGTPVQALPPANRDDTPADDDSGGSPLVSSAAEQ